MSELWPKNQLMTMMTQYDVIDDVIKSENKPRQSILQSKLPIYMKFQLDTTRNEWEMA